MLAAVRSGELSEHRINESVLRILRLKFQRGPRSVLVTGRGAATTSTLAERIAARGGWG